MPRGSWNRALGRAIRRRLRDSSPVFTLNQCRLRIAGRRGVEPGAPVRTVQGIQEPLLALTYDDGPSPVNTPRLLDILRERQARATFFVVGSEVDRNTDLLARVAAEGHEIGNHSISHTNPLELDDNALRADIERAHEAISRVVAGPSLYRPPFGKKPKESAGICRALGMTSVLWSIDSGDTRGFATDRIVHEVVGRARPGDIVLMHDGGEHRPRTLEATRRILEELTARGYRFVTVSELFAASVGAKAE
jgi:peptidoglycan-N-acetylglucosamine deacetylase